MALQTLAVEQFGIFISEEIMFMFLGEQIGRGNSRVVYANKFDHTTVVKIEVASKSFNNSREWDIWNDLKANKKWSRWLAPCISISTVGSVLIQAKTEPVNLTDLKKELKEVPEWLTDLKPSNWGRYDGRIVCHDYGNHLLINGAMNGKMRKANWWE